MLQRRSSPIAQLSSSPRLWWFMLGLFPSAIGVGLFTVARITYATEAFGSELGIGTVGLVAALAGAVAGVPLGLLSDRMDARRMALVFLSLFTVALALEALACSRRGAVAPWMVIALSALQGLCVAGWIIALAKVQASLVPPPARGSAEIVNLLRMGVGSLIGTVVAPMISPATAMALAAASCAWAVVIVWVVAGPVPPAQQRAAQSMREVAAAMSRNRGLRAAVIVDLGLCLVFPTQLVATMVVDLAAHEAVTYALGAGFVGLVAGRLLLLRVGVGGDVARRLLAWLLVWVLLLVGGWVSLATGWVMGREEAISFLLGSGSLVIGYTLGLTAALVQQRSPDDIRGRVTGVVGAVRYLVSAAGVVALTAVIGFRDSRLGLILLVVLALAMLVVLTRVRSLNSEDEA